MKGKTKNGQVKHEPHRKLSKYINFVPHCVLCIKGKCGNLLYIFGKILNFYHKNRQKDECYYENGKVLKSIFPQDIR